MLANRQLLALVKQSELDWIGVEGSELNCRSTLRVGDINTTSLISFNTALVQRAGKLTDAQVSTPNLYYLTL